ncbi:MAG: STAS domain-containing protein [Spirochaetales bacterium]|nr:STAS domain-containing protein [Spirochaetales bacterium]
MEQLSITEKEGANYHLYELQGSLNAYTLGEFQSTLYDAIQKNNIVLDMSRLIELDPAGVGVLMAAFNDSEEIDHKLYFMSMSNEAEKAIAATGFKSKFNLITSVTEAV